MLLWETHLGVQSSVHVFWFESASDCKPGVLTLEAMTCNRGHNINLRGLEMTKEEN